MKADFEQWLSAQFADTGPFTVFIVLVRIAGEEVVPLKSSFAHLIGDDFDEGVVTAFRLHTQIEGAQHSGIRARLCGVPLAVHGDSLEEIIRLPQHVALGELCSEKMSHRYLPGGAASTTA